MRAERQPKTLGLCACLLCACLFCAVGCGEPEQPTAPAPPAPDVVLEVGGIRVTRAEIEAFDAYFDEIDPHMGRRYRTRELLDQYLLPLKLAQRAFPAERERAGRNAADLSSVAGNYLELVKKGTIVGGSQPELPWSRGALPLPVSRYGFQLENLGRTSPPIETPRGFVVIAGQNMAEGVTRLGDRLHAFVVEFPTHDPVEFDRWLHDAQTRLAGAVTYVHADLERALPNWLCR